jgi:hypothetical protein
MISCYSSAIESPILSQYDLDDLADMEPIQKHCQTVMSTHHILEAEHTRIESKMVSPSEVLIVEWTLCQQANGFWRQI